ncbi:unnamed protein product [Caenorhabditis nigoni]
MQSDGSGRLIDSRSARQVHWKIFCDKSIETTHIRTVNDTLVVKHRKKAKYLTSLRTSAMQISAYTISYALIYLYDFMEKVEVEDIIYADTDSIVYSIPDGEEDPLENNTGDLKNCGHAVCRGCLERLIMPPQRPDLMPVLRCPVCRKIGCADPTRARPVYAMMPGTLPVRPIHMDF